MVDEETPEALIDALALDDDAAAAWKRLPPPQRREYIEWIDEADSDEGRNQRASKAVERLRQDKADL